MRWRLVIVTSEGVYRDPLRTLERVRDALLECGATGIRRTFKPEWKLHFPVRSREPSKRRLKRVEMPLETLVGHPETETRMHERGQAGAVSDRMSIRQPVSRAASRAF
jgi:hypothetical protein